MGSYILNFTVYTMAMCGLICFALFVYKKFATGGFISKKSQFLDIEETLTLAPRKTLYVIKAGDEKFLIAADADKTTLISKLGENTTVNQVISQRQQAYHIEKPTNSAVSVDFESQLQRTKPTEQKIQRTQQVRQPQQQSYMQNNNSYQKSNLEYNGKTTLIEVEDFPEIKTTKKRSKKSNDILKNMVERVKG